jgi:hypothetical protein
MPEPERVPPRTRRTPPPQPGEAPDHAAVGHDELLRLQRTAGNRAVSSLVKRPSKQVQRTDQVVQRDGFVPQVTRDPDFDIEVLGGDVGANVAVTNAAAAPAGTRFQWHWDNHDDSIAHATVDPPQGPRGRMHALAKGVGETDAAYGVATLENGDQPNVTVAAETAPMHISVQAPEVSWRDQNIIGARAPTTPRVGHMYVGDTLNIIATFPTSTRPQDTGLTFPSMGTAVGGHGFDGVTITPATWTNPHEAVISVTAITAGTRHLNVGMLAPGLEVDSAHDVEIRVVEDPEYFKGRCGTAESTLNGLHAAGRKWFMDCFTNYQTGYQRHQAALDKQHEADKLTDDLILGVLLAGIGGAAGATIGGLVKNSGVLKEALTTPQLEGLTDAAKDLTKYVVRLPANSTVRSKLMGSSHSAPGTPPPPSTSAGNAGVAQGSGVAAGVQPMQWMTHVDGKIGAERASAGVLLSGFQEAADEALAYPSGANNFDWDPVIAVLESATIDGNPVDQLGPIPSADNYEEAFWITWIQTYAYGISVTASKAGAVFSLEDNLGKSLKSEIDAVATRLGSSGDAWLAQYAEPARAAMQARVDDQNAHRFVVRPSDIPDR